jgi:hypothetical protein
LSEILTHKAEGRTRFSYSLTEGAGTVEARRISTKRPTPQAGQTFQVRMAQQRLDHQQVHPFI